MNAAIPSCTRRKLWEADRLFADSPQFPNRQNFVDSFRNLLSTSKRPLIWIDGADVATVRAAVELASVWPATIHVHQPVGSKIVTSVTCEDGWFGTTLADAALHSQLVIVLGNRWIRSMPLLRQRFFPSRSNQLWWSIFQPASSDLNDSKRDPALGPNERHSSLHKDQWYRALCKLSLEVADNNPAMASPLGRAILNSANTTILWDKLEATHASDEAWVRQVVQLAHLRSQTARCNLLALDSESGAESAASALLWLTGCVGTAKPIENGWTSPSRYRFYELHDWQAEFDTIVAIRTTPSLEPLIAPNANSMLLSSSAGQHTLANYARHFFVGSPGVDHDGLLIRGDHGSTIYASATDSISDKIPDNFTGSTSSTTKVESAAELLGVATELARHRMRGAS